MESLFTLLAILVQFNFIGRLLGPRGNLLKRIEATTGCHVFIRGKGSIKDPGKVNIILVWNLTLEPGIYIHILLCMQLYISEIHYITSIKLYFLVESLILGRREYFLRRQLAVV